MTSAGEPSFHELVQSFEALPPDRQRGVLSLLGLAIGDSVGLPFELHSHRQHRDDADEIAAQGDGAHLREFVLGLIIERLGRRGPTNAFARTFSDDTACADLRMAAVAQWAALQGRDGFSQWDPGELMWRCLLSQMLAWALNSNGALFQGTGGFTNGLLRPKVNVPPSVDIQAGIPGCDTWPEDWFAQHAEACCAGGTAMGSNEMQDCTGGSWGNGAVMSFAPQAIATHIAAGRAAVGDVLGAASAQPASGGADLWPPAAALRRLQETHRHPEAKFGAALLDELLGCAFRHEISSCSALRRCCLQSQTWQELIQSPLVASGAYPLEAFNTFLQRGDCDGDDVSAFVSQATGVPSPPLAMELGGAYLRGSGNVGARMGQLLRTMANWDDNGLTRERLPAPDSQGLLRFSQRGLNSVLIAIWCVCGAVHVWDWVVRLLYVGGDADTIGAICGQLACPLLEADDVLQSFRLLAVGDLWEDRRPCAAVSSAAMLRFFSRAVHFCRGSLRELVRHARLVDPIYPGLAVVWQGRAVTAWTSPEAAVLQVMWVDHAFTGRNRRGGHAEARLKAAESLEWQGWAQIRRFSSIADGPLEVLGEARVGSYVIDAVVTELEVDGEREFGLQLLQCLDSLWGTTHVRRPHFIMLTARGDRAVSNRVRAVRETSLVRHDRPQDIVTKVCKRCVAATVPKVLPKVPDPIVEVDDVQVPSCEASPARPVDEDAQPETVRPTPSSGRLSL